MECETYLIIDGRKDSNKINDTKNKTLVSYYQLKVVSFQKETQQIHENTNAAIQYTWCDNSTMFQPDRCISSSYIDQKIRSLDKCIKADSNMFVFDVSFKKLINGSTSNQVGVWITLVQLIYISLYWKSTSTKKTVPLRM